jgi:hypothetical protein
MNEINKSIYNNLELLPEDLQGWNGNSKVFQKLIDSVNPKVIIEVGTWKGLSAITMAEHVKHTNKSTKIYCVDTWLGAIEFWSSHKSTPERDLLLKNGYPNIYYQFLSNVVHRKVEDIIIPFPNTSYIGYLYFQSQNIKADMIYIDASHDEFDVYNDIKHYMRILNTNGVIFGDDYTSWGGVKAAVDRYSYENDLDVQLLEDNFWVINKK